MTDLFVWNPSEDGDYHPATLDDIFDALNLPIGRRGTQHRLRLQETQWDVSHPITCADFPDCTLVRDLRDGGADELYEESGIGKYVEAPTEAGYGWWKEPTDG